MPIVREDGGHILYISVFFSVSFVIFFGERNYLFTEWAVFIGDNY